jgi:hypothetical protein
VNMTVDLDAELDPKNFYQLEDILSKIRFRKHHVFIDRSIGADLRVTAMMEVKDNRNSYRYNPMPESYSLSAWESPDRLDRIYADTSPDTKVATSYEIPTYIRTVRQFVRFVFGVISALEFHEIKEDFYFVGKRVFDPHAPGNFDPTAEELMVMV